MSLKDFLTGKIDYLYERVNWTSHVRRNFARVYEKQEDPWGNIRNAYNARYNAYYDLIVKYSRKNGGG
jgi:hypothetical protein